MGQTLGVETVSCRHCHAIYVAAVNVNGDGSTGSHTCEVCGEVATWTGDRSYSDFHLVHKPNNWKPAER